MLRSRGVRFGMHPRAYKKGQYRALESFVEDYCGATNREFGGTLNSSLAYRLRPAQWGLHPGGQISGLSVGLITPRAVRRPCCQLGQSVTTDASLVSQHVR